MSFFNVTVFRLCLALILGILLEKILNISLQLLEYSIISIILLLFGFWYWHKDKLIPRLYFECCVYVTFIILGAYLFQLQIPLNRDNHYTKTGIKGTPVIQLKIEKTLKSNAYHYKYIAQVKSLNGVNTSGSILLLIQKDSSSRAVYIDDILISKQPFSAINKPLNPYQFNYKAYMARQGIYNQIRIKPYEVLDMKKGKSTLSGLADKLRRTIHERLKGYGFKSEELAVFNALLLGQRQDISNELYQAYANAGAVHVLAVSGLHIGIILLLLNFIFKPLERIAKGNLIKTLVLIFLLWTYAVLAGLSPSVIRAVTMFSFFAIGMNLNRPTNALNTLFSSMLVLLLIAPSLLFEVGFQLSYTAVLGIILMHPLFNKIYRPSYAVPRFFWNLLTVSLIAQLAVLPLSLYYFHQFPGLFFFSSLVIIPCLGIILGGGIGVIILALLNKLPVFLAEIYNSLLSLMNRFIEWVAQQENFIFQDISFSLYNLLAAYLFIGTVVWGLKKVCFKRAVLVVLSIIVLQMSFIFDKIRFSNQQLVVFHQIKKTLIGYKNGAALTVFSSLDSIKNYENRRVKSYAVKVHINAIDVRKLAPVFRYKKKRILVLDSLGICPKLNADIIILTQNTRVNLNRLIHLIKPKQIVADGSNYPSLVKRWRASAKKKNIAFHYTGTKGAFVLD